MVEGQTVVDMFPAGPGMLLYTQPGMLIAVVAPAELAVNTLLPYSVAVGLPETTNFAEFGEGHRTRKGKKSWSSQEIIHWAPNKKPFIFHHLTETT